MSVFTILPPGFIINTIHVTFYENLTQYFCMRRRGMKRSLAWITSIIFILGIAGNATAGNLNALISKNYLVSADASGNYNKGVQQAREGNYSRAQKLFERVVRQDSKHVGALSYLSVVYANTKQYNSAIKTAKKALKLDATDEMANQVLVRIYETRGSWKQMVTPLKALTQNYGHNSRYFAKLGEAHFRLKHYKEALDPLQQAVTLNSMDYVNAYRLGEVQARMGNYESAVGYLEQSLSSAPSRTVKYYNMGLVYGHLKRHDEAIRYFEMALSEKPGMASAYYNIGAMYQNSEQPDSAIENYEKALQFDSNLEMASTNLKYLKDYLVRQKEQQEKAREMTLEKTAPERPEDLFEAPAEEAPAIEENSVDSFDATPDEEPVDSFDAVQEDTPEVDSFDTFEETPPVEESFDTAEETPDGEIAVDSFDAGQEEAPVDSFDAAQEDTVDSFDTVEEAPPVEESFDTAEEAPAEDIAVDSFDTAGESGVESPTDDSESPEVTPVGTSDENPEVTPIGTSEDSFETNTGDEPGSENPEAAVEEPTTEETPEGFEDAVDSSDYSFRNF